MKDIKYALKFIKRQPINNIIRSISITLGLFVGIVSFAWVSYQFSYDKMYSHWDRIYQLWSISADYSGWRNNTFNDHIAPFMERELPQIEAATSSFSSYNRAVYKYRDKEYTTYNLYVDTSYFDIFDFKIIKGDPHKIFTSADNIMISESFAERVFKGDNPIGKGIEDIETKKSYTVMGIYEDMPVNNHRGGSFGMLQSIIQCTDSDASLAENRNFFTYFKLRKGTDCADMEREIYAFFQRHNAYTQIDKDSKTTFILNPITYSHNNGYPYFPIHIIAIFVAILTLLVSCLNYILLSISILVKRTKTIGMLKCAGAGKKDVFRITLWENIVLILSGTLITLILIIIFRNPFSQMMNLPMKELFGFSNIWSSVLTVLMSILFVGFVNGLLSSRIPAKAAIHWHDKSHMLWKKVILFVQLLISTSAIVFLIYISIQIKRMEHNDLGYSKENLYHISASGNAQALDFIKSQINSVSGVLGCTYSTSIPIYGWNNYPCYDQESREVLFYCRRLSIEENYLEFMGMKLVAGSNIAVGGGSLQLLINEAYAEKMGWSAEEAVGKSIIHDKDAKTTYTVVGVVNNIRMGEYGVFTPCAMGPIEYGEGREASVEMLIRSDGVNHSTLKEISDKMGDVLEKDVYVHNYAQTHRERLSYEIAVQKVLIIASVLCLIITIMGLIGFIGEEMTRRRKEIAIRKINGAYSGEVILHIIRETLPFSIPPIVIAVIVTYIGGGFLITNFPPDNRAPLYWWIFIISALLVMCVVLSVVVLRSLKTAKENPAEVIKQEI